MMDKLTLIAAMDQNRAIGKGNTIPWHYPEDFAHFKQETLGTTLIMGRSTWDSIGRPLPHRRTIVLTRDEHWSPGVFDPEVGVATNLEAALHLADSYGLEVMVAGGSQIYALTLPLATHQVLTHLPISVEDADTFYPAFAKEEWNETHRVEKNELVYSWLHRI